MPFGEWFRPPRHLLALFLAVTVVPATALAWLSWRLLEQDRALESQRIQERLEHAADLIAAAIERRLSEALDKLPDAAEDVLVVTFTPHRVEARGLLYQPFVPPAQEPPRGVFEAGEALEFRQQDYDKAMAAFRELARSKDPVIRAGALVRLGRNLRKNNQHREALAAYEELARLGTVPVGGTPAELLAMQARCVVLEELKQSAELQRAASALYADLQRGRWQLDRISYQFHSQEAGRRLGASPETPTVALALAAGVESLWAQWQEIRRGEGSPQGRRAVWVHGRSVLLLWKSSAEKLVALVAGPRYLESQWQSAWRHPGVSLALTDSDGHNVMGRPAAPGQRQAVRTAADTRLPWTLRVISADPKADLAQLAGRRRLLLAGLAMMGVLVLVGSYFTARAAARELAVARLQSDFVSAVSHEFRTPLTSLRHLTELLEGGIVSDEERRRQYYSALGRESARLHRLVESLLSFGRMEAGAIEYCFEAVNPSELVGDVVAEFQNEVSMEGRRVELTSDGAAPAVRADREALGRALWNLLDNAVKYSPACPTVWVDLAREGERVAIRVRDQGLGIPAEEQKEIFRKFVRGAAAKAASVKGTGIGLALVQHIVQAHGGEVRLESQPGRGSTFTILLPVGDQKT
jgi:signal transduction histidine kinase